MTFKDAVSRFDSVRSCEFCPLSVEDKNGYHCGLPRSEYAFFTCSELISIYSLGVHALNKILNHQADDFDK